MKWQEVFDENLKELEINMHYLVKEADYGGSGGEKVDEVITEYYELSEVSAYETQEPYEHVQKIEALIQKGNGIFDQRPSKVKSLDAVNMWTLAEMGTERGKKLHKKAIKRKRRVLEKREFEKEMKTYLND